MATVTWGCNKDARIAYNGSNLGAGASDFNPVGSYGGYDYRTLLGFAYSFAGMTAITSAILYVRTSTQYYVGFGSDPDLLTVGLSAAWSEGSSSSMSTSNAVHWGNQPGSVGSPSAVADVPTSESTWVAINITNVIQNAFINGVFHGLRLYAPSTSSTDVTEFYSREQGSSDPYIVVTYESNNPPVAPTGSSPVHGVPTSDTTPTFVFTASDPDAGDTLQLYNLQVATDANFTNKVWDVVSGSSGISGWTVTRTYAGTALVPGTTYYWRANVRDASAYSPWSSTRTFSLNRAPTVVFTTPNAMDGLVEVTKTAGGGVNPRMVVRWTFSDVDAGDSQTAYQVVVTNDNNSAFYDSGKTVSTSKSRTVPVDVVRGAFYKVTVTVWDESDASGTTGLRRCQTNWGVVEYRIDTGGVVTSWSASPTSVAGTNKKVVLEYASSSAGGAISTWFSGLGAADLNRWFHWRAYLFAWSGATTPSISKMSLAYSSSAAVPPDGWTITANHSLDRSVRVYGTQSLRIACTGANRIASQLVLVEPNTDYIFSGRIRSEGNSGSRIRLSETPGGGSVANDAGEFVTSPTVNGTQEFTATKTPIWNSGANTSIYVQCFANGASGNSGWFDALKMEASTVVTPWTPGFIGPALSVDSGGIQVDRSEGGILRLQGSAGATYDTVELGTHGLLFGGNVEVFSPTSGALKAVPTSAVQGQLGVEAASGQRSVLTATISGDSSSRAAIFGDATVQGLELGPGNAARDVNLYRAGADLLATDDHMRLGGRLRFFGAISPPQLTANQQNWNPTGLAFASIIRISTDTTVRTIGGIIAGTDGDMLILVNVNGATTITLSHADSGSTLANQFLCPNSVAYSLLHRAMVIAIYDGASTRWRLMN